MLKSLAPRATRQGLMASKKGSAYEDLVGAAMRAFDPGATVETGHWVEGPDGRRELDVVIRGDVEGTPRVLLIECKDFDPAKTGKVGIEYVDALESKRRDLGVDGAFLSSNSGFTDGALKKAKRTGIGLISVLKAGDKRVKLELQEVINVFHIDIVDVKATYHLLSDEGPVASRLLRAEYSGKPVATWIQHRAGIIVSADPAFPGGRVSRKQCFREPVDICADGECWSLAAITIDVEATVEWRRQVATLDASLGLYDYIRGTVRLAPGKQSLDVTFNVDRDAGEVVQYEPEYAGLAGALLPGEQKFLFGFVNNTAHASECPDLDGLLEQCPD